ncbi:MAG: long-chain fatty acid--CoA ligase [Chloroflexi bacterium]|nr:long-chain fatty acid--CoA ligase [Chloroflexota bacterium]
MADYPWYKHYDEGVPHTLEPYPQLRTFDLLDDVVNLNPDHPMLIFQHKRLSWKTVSELSDQMAAALVAKGVKKGDRVALLFINTPQVFIAFYAIWKAGAIVVPLNPLYTPSELEYAINEVGAEVAFVLSFWYNTLKGLNLKTKLRLIIVTELNDYMLGKDFSAPRGMKLQEGDIWWSDLMQEFAGARRPDVEVSPQDPAAIMFSGGTTGIPKGVVGSHISYAMTGLQLKAWFEGRGTEWENSMVVSLPLFHTMGVYFCFAMTPVNHFTMILIADPRNQAAVLQTVRETRPTMLTGTPTMFISLLEQPDLKPDDLKFVKNVGLGAAPLMADTKRKIDERISGFITEGYGLSESTMAMTTTPAGGVWKEGSVGVPLPDTIIRIVDVETGTKNMKSGEAGEVIMKAPQLMLGFWNRSKETAEVLRDGWLYTGDIGYLDEDGYLFLTARKKDVIKPGGFQVWPREVEEVLTEHPAVSEVCVGGIPDPRQVEAVKAWVVLKEGKKVTPEELQNHCREKLAAYKVPRFIEFRDSLPKTMVGKVLRRLLVEEERAKSKK